MYSSLATGAAGGPAKKCACYDTNFRHRQRFLIPGARQSPVMPTPQALSSTRGSRSQGSSWSASGLGSLGLGRDGFDGRPPRCVLPSRRLPQPRAHSPRARTWLTASWRHPRSLRNPGRSTGFTDCMPPESPGIRQTSIRAMTKHQSENAVRRRQDKRAGRASRAVRAQARGHPESVERGAGARLRRIFAAQSGCRRRRAAQHRTASFRRSGVAHSCNDRLLDRGVHALFQTTGARPVRVPDR